MAGLRQEDPRFMQSFSLSLGGRPLQLEVGELAHQANGAVLVRYGGTAVLVTATMSKSPREGIDFFPLLVDYEERLYAVGKIPGGFIKREGRPTEAAILSARMIDRPLRPLFPDGFRHDVQVVATVLSVDQDHQPDLCGIIGASAALAISDIPFARPVGAVRMGRVDGRFVVNPSADERERSDLNLTVAGTKDAILMVEAGANELAEEQLLEAIMLGHEAIKELVALQERMQAEVGQPKVEVTLSEVPADFAARVAAWAQGPMVSAIRTKEKLEREAKINAVRQETHAHFEAALGEEYAARRKDTEFVLDTILKEEVRRLITQEHVRPDGRRLEEIRPLEIKVGVLPRVHGSGLFQRGQTQVLTSCTLGMHSDVQLLDGLGLEEQKRYMHHYNFPAYSVGEVRPMRGPGRREIGHGALAERALLPLIPSEEGFPYTIRLVSEVLSSNGSTSQAAVCGSTLALLDAGVPLRKPVAGIAMGLVKYGEEFSILTDIQGLEDHLGDMDFKVAGTRDGVTALQMDIKIHGVSREILRQALAQAREARLFILARMSEVIPAPRAELSPFAPRILTMNVDPEKIRDVIGSGGKTIRRIISETKAEIDVEDDGTIFIASPDLEAARRAMKIIETLTREIAVGEFYQGRVSRIMDFGAFVEIAPGKEGLIRLGHLADRRVNKVEDVVKVGDEVTVKVIEIDSRGRINLSRKDALKAEPVGAQQ
jgi:polyribonucleotide nucleotidyltransferase